MHIGENKWENIKISKSTTLYTFYMHKYYAKLMSVYNF